MLGSISRTTETARDGRDRIHDVHEGSCHRSFRVAKMGRNSLLVALLVFTLGQSGASFSQEERQKFRGNKSLTVFLKEVLSRRLNTEPSRSLSQNATMEPSISPAPTFEPSELENLNGTFYPSDEWLNVTESSGEWLNVTESPSGEPSMEPPSDATDSPAFQTSEPTFQPTDDTDDRAGVLTTAPFDGDGGFVDDDDFFSVPTDVRQSDPATDPTVAPSPEPTSEPTREIISNQDGSLTSEPTVLRTRPPAIPPVAAATPQPTPSPTPQPTPRPTPALTPAPTTRRPTLAPTGRPTVRPTLGPTQGPTLRPTARPSLEPTRAPSKEPTPSPTVIPTRSPTQRPTRRPTIAPTGAPSIEPTNSPTRRPTSRPTLSPTESPTDSPSSEPTLEPSGVPSPEPTTPDPTPSGTLEPTVDPTAFPTTEPSLSMEPTTPFPTGAPSMSPSDSPTISPSSAPTLAEQEALVVAVMSLYPYSSEETLSGTSAIFWERETEDFIRGYILRSGIDPPLFDLEINANIVDQFFHEAEPINNGSLLQETAASPPIRALSISFDIQVVFRSETDQQNLDALVFGAWDTAEDRERYVGNLKQRSLASFEEIDGVSLVVEGYEPPIPTSPPTAQAPTSNSSNAAVIAGASVGGAALLLLIVFLFVRRSGGESVETGKIGQSQVTSETPAPSKVAVSTEILVEPQDDVSTLGDPMFAPGGMLMNGLEKDEVTASVGDDYDYARQYRLQTGQANSLSDRANGRARLLSEEMTKTSSANSTTISKLGRMGDSLFADDASFEQQFAEPEERFDVVAPAGKLGMVIDTPNGGMPVVHAIKDTSVLADRVKVGDRLLSVDGEDCTAMTAMQVSKLISLKSEKPARVLVFARSRAPQPGN